MIGLVFLKNYDDGVRYMRTFDSLAVNTVILSSKSGDVVANKTE